MINTHNIERLSQPRDDLCWYTCAKIVWRWKYGRQYDQVFNKHALPWVKVSASRGGLDRKMMGTFYVRDLGMRLTSSDQAEMIIGISPLIYIVFGRQDAGHASVLYGVDRGRHLFFSWDPAAAVRFQDDGKGAQVGATRAESFRSFSAHTAISVWGWPGHA